MKMDKNKVKGKLVIEHSITGNYWWSIRVPHAFPINQKMSCGALKTANRSARRFADRHNIALDMGDK